MKVAEIIKSTVANKCPRCHEGPVFENNNPYSIRNGLSMHKNCPVCGLRYEMETGFFYGAMYVSYGLVAGLFILFFTIDALWLHMDALKMALIFTFMVLALFPLTYRWSRSIWINFFVKYEPRFKKARNKKEPKQETINA